MGVGSGDLPDRYIRHVLTSNGRYGRAGCFTVNEGGTTGLPSFIGQGPFLFFSKIPKGEYIGDFRVVDPSSGQLKANITNLYAKEFLKKNKLNR